MQTQSKYAESAAALKKLQENDRVRDIRLLVPENACPVCAACEGTYPKEAVPALPIEGCSTPGGCNCYYEPMLSELYP